MKKIFHFIRSTWLITGITLLFIALIETGFTVYYRIKPQVDELPIPDFYKDSSWYKDYLTEFARCSEENWHPYVYWRRKPFVGKYINIDENGYRRTVIRERESIPGKKPVRIFMMGGSAMWGTGVRDGYTLASLADAELAKFNIRTEIINCGESGYVNTQEMADLYLQLRQGNIPDLVIFYDGVNDLFSTYQQKISGIPQNENNRKKEFNALRSKKKSIWVFLESLKTLSTVKFITNLFPGDIKPLPYTQEEIQQLVTATMYNYESNIQTIDLWAEKYGFRVLFYWQPTIYCKSVMSEYERQEADKFEFMKDMIKAANAKTIEIATDSAVSAFHDINTIFTGEIKSVFLDYCHVNEYGNLVIASKMAKDIIEVLDLLKQ